MKRYNLNHLINLIYGMIMFNLQVSAQTIVKVPDISLESYTGVYNASANFSLTFIKDAEHLVLHIPGQPSIDFYPESQTKFFIKEKSGVTVEFIKNNEGVVDKVLLIQDGQRVIATKLTSEIFNPEKHYSIIQLKEDFNFLRSTLEKNHPRLYEFTPKASFNRYFDSLYRTINRPMNEIEFRYFLLPIIAKVHCGHTSLEQTVLYGQQRPTLLPPFVLYYEGERAFIRSSADSLLLPGTEVLEINNTPVTVRITNFLKRVSADGIHSSVQYYIMNKPMSWFIYEIPEWYNVKNYKLLVKKDGENIEVNLKALEMSEFIKFNPPPPGNKNQLDIIADHSSAILTYPRLDYPTDSIRNRFLNDTFLELKNKKVTNLIIDLRGNGGGTPLNAAYFLRYLMDKDFVYSNTSSISEYTELTNITSVDENRYKGKMYFLIDGGSFSSTSHILSFVKKYKLGTLIGELSSGSYSCNTIGFPFPLPNSQLILKCATGIYETSVKGQDRAKGIVPDYEVRNSLTNILNGQDKILEFAKKLAFERK